MIKVSVIIPNWNGENLLPDCLFSLQNQSCQDFEIILVDNKSLDKSLDYVRGNFPQVKIKRLNKNYGFARACNEGVEISNAKYVIFLNNDTKVDKYFLNSLLECANNHPEVISVNSKLLNFENRKIIDGVGILINEVGQARSIGWQEKDHGQFEKEEYIFGATGGASLFRRKEFVKLGGFDENYFMYFEEVDFAFRAQFQGFKSIYCPNAIVYHKHKATAKKFPAKIEYWQFRNMTLTILKDFPIKLILKKGRLLKIILVHLNTIFYQIKKGFWWVPFLADFWILFHLPEILRQRKEIQSNIKVREEYLEEFLQDKKITFWKLRK